MIYLKEKAKTDPLIVAVNFHVVSVCGHFVNTEVWHLNSNLFVERALDQICMRDPTIRVEDIFWNILGMDAVNWVTDILTSGDN